MPAIQWASFDPVTGRIIEELPGLKLGSSLPAQIGKSTGSVQAQLPITDRLPQRWELATRSWRAVLAAVFDDPQQTVLWAGPVERRTYGSGPTIDLTLIDVPGWMDRQYTPTATLLGVEQTAVMRQVGLNQAAAQFHGQVIATPTGTTIDRRYKNGDDRTMLTAVSEVAKANGPEWCINWRIDSDGTLVCLPTVAARIGRAATSAGVYPVVLDRLPWTITEDYAPGKGAPTVTGTSSAGGDQRIQVIRTASVERIAAEYRFQPEVAKPTTAQVTTHTEAKLAAIRNGTKTLTLDIPITSDLVVGRDLQLGDDIEADLANPDLPALNRTVRGRLFGWSAEADPRTGQIVKVTPILSADDGS